MLCSQLKIANAQDRVIVKNIIYAHSLHISNAVTWYTDYIPVTIQSAGFQWELK